MNEQKVTIRKRINLSLPQETLQIINQAVEKGRRSHFVNEAIKYYLKEIGRARLRKQLREGAISRAERDLGLSN